jgi:hypothetical protein
VCGQTYFAGLDRKRTRSSRRMEGWRAGGGNSLRAMTAYAVLRRVKSRSASVSVCDGVLCRSAVQCNGCWAPTEKCLQPSGCACVAVGTLDAEVERCVGERQETAREKDDSHNNGNLQIFADGVVTHKLRSRVEGEFFACGVYATRLDVTASPCHQTLAPDPAAFTSGAAPAGW